MAVLSRATKERFANIAFGLNAWAWSVLGLATCEPEDRLTVARWCIAVLHALVGLMFMQRTRLQRSGTNQQLLAAVPSLVLSGLVFSFAASPREWSLAANAIFLTGTAIALVAFSSLRRNFAVLPALRGITNTGLYRVVRHPAYLGELMLVVGCVVSNPGTVALVLLAASLIAIVLRIRAEEQLLMRSPEYSDYAKTVRHRVLPGIW